MYCGNLKTGRLVSLFFDTAINILSSTLLVIFFSCFNILLFRAGLSALSLTVSLRA